MRYDAEHKARTRTRVLGEAARALRQEGAAGLGVADVMRRSGLTHGGFYAHFPSRDALVAEALAGAFASRSDAFAAAEADPDPRAGLVRFVKAYLSRGHRDDPGAGCPLPALSGELPRLPEEARRAFGEGVARLTARLGALMAAAGVAAPETAAGSVLAEMVGAVALARALPDRAESDRVLKRSRDAILARLGLGA
jgi:TetR/AcrR family transcriptional regulator, transcriptional repressor for nem operon